MSLGIGRIAVVVALVVGGVAVLASAFDTPASAPVVPGSHVSSSPSTRPHSTPTPTPPPRKTGVKIAVFNGTSSAGIAAQVQQMLQQDGYVPAQQATNSPVTPINHTVVYYRNDAAAAQNHADAQYIATKYFKGARVAELGLSFTDLARGASVAIVLGQDYANSGA